jgi:hypothetical protein
MKTICSPNERLASSVSPLFPGKPAPTPTASHVHPLLLTFTGICSLQRGHLVSVASRYLYPYPYIRTRVEFMSQRKQSIRGTCRPILPDEVLSPAAVPRRLVDRLRMTNRRLFLIAFFLKVMRPVFFPAFSRKQDHCLGRSL